MEKENISNKTLRHIEYEDIFRYMNKTVVCQIGFDSEYMKYKLHRYVFGIDEITGNKIKSAMLIDENNRLITVDLRKVYIEEEEVRK